MMAPEDDQSEEDAPTSKKKTKKMITLERKMDILRRFDRGESKAAIKRRFRVGNTTLHNVRKNRERIMAAVKLGAGSATRVTPRNLQFPTLQGGIQATFGECNYYYPISMLPEHLHSTLLSHAKTT